MAKLENVKTLDMVNGEIMKVEYGGEVYVKVIEEVALNDIVLSRGVKDARSGNFYVVNERDRYDDISILDDEGEKRSLLKQFDVFRKQSVPSLDERVSVLETKVATIEKKSEAAETAKERITHNGAEYKLVDRKAQAGDVVVFTKNKSVCFRNGVVYGPVNGCMEVKDKDGDFINVYYSLYNRTTDTVKVYEPVALKVGDYAKVIEKEAGFAINTIVKIIGDDKSNIPFRISTIDGNDSSWCERRRLVRATDEEVAEAKRQAEAQAEQAKLEAKWASIGRKPNEFKKGDIVNNVGSAKCGYGEIIAVVDGRYVVNYSHPTYGRCYEGAELIELITPVESRFDHA